MTFRKLSGAITAIALGAAALMAFPATASAQPRVHEEGFVVECSGAGDGYTASVTLFQNSQFGNEATVVIETAEGTLLGVISDGRPVPHRWHYRRGRRTTEGGEQSGACGFGDGQRQLHRFRRAHKD